MQNNFDCVIREYWISIYEEEPGKAVENDYLPQMVKTDESELKNNSFRRLWANQCFIFSINAKQTV